MRISDDVLRSIKERCPIEETISRYVTLKPNGSRFVGLCPFHSEKTPSFTVFTDTQSFYCFGCGAGGDVITFVMREESLEYPEAVKLLADRAGVRLEQNEEEEKAARQNDLAYTQKAYPQTVPKEFKGLAHAELVLMFPERFYEEVTRFLSD